MSSLTDEQCLEAYDALRTAGGNQSQAARSLGLHRATYRNRLERYYSRNLGGDKPVEVMPGHEIKSESTTYDRNGNVRFRSYRTGKESGDTFEMPPSMTLDRGTFQVDASGKIERQWLKAKTGPGSREELIEAIRTAAGDLVQNPITVDLAPAPEADDDLLNLHPLPDLHLGLYAWGRQTGMSWDLKTALAVYQKTMQTLIARSPSAGTGIILGGGDLLHADDETKRTRKSGNVLDVDTRYPKVLSEACKLMVYQVELAKAKYPHVIARILPGNHDEDSAVAVTWFLEAWFRNDERVTVDTDPSEFWFHQFGEVMLGAVHGHNAKIKDMPGIMAARRKEMWGTSTFRYAHGFHVHHASGGRDEAGGVRYETHQSPAAQDGYHDSHGYISGRSLATISYHRERGEVGRSTENIT